MLASRTGDAERVALAGTLAWSRTPDGAECRSALNYISRVRERLTKTGTDRDTPELPSWTAYAKVLLMGNEFYYID